MKKLTLRLCNFFFTFATILLLSISQKSFSQTLDQNGNSGSFGANLIVNNVNGGQSFRAGISGQLNSIKLDINYSASPTIAGTFTLTVYSGVGFGGAVLGTQNFNVTSTTGQSGSAFLIDLSPAAINITAGNFYTFGLSSSTGSLCLFTSNNGYVNGTLFSNSTADASRDIWFQTFVNGPATHLNFDGVNDHVTAPSLNVANQSFSIEFWHKRNVAGNGTYQYILSQGAANANQLAAILFRTNDVLSFSFWGNDLDAVAAITDANWHHYACVYNSTTKLQSIYIDGVLNASRTATANTTATGTLFIGGFLGAAQTSNGNLDELRFWNYDLTSTDINRRKNCELVGTESGLIRYYKFNQGADGGINTGITSLTDAASGANNGTLTNFALSSATSNWLSGSPVITGSTIPTAPTSSAQTLCSGATVANLVPAPGSTIKWYNVAAGGSPLLTTTVLATGTYYATGANANGCESARTPVSITINALPVVNAVSNQTLCNGTATTAVNFTGTAGFYTWTNNNTTIGLAASGAGNISSFTATNTGSNVVTATITATPNTGGILAYVPNSGSGTVSIINTATNTTVASVPVGTNPFGVAVSPNSSRVYVTNLLSGNVSVINTATNLVVATVAVGTNPFCIAVSPNGSRAYVTYNGNSLSVINTATNTVTATVTVGTNPLGVAVSPDGSKVYVVNEGSSNVSVVNTATNTVAATVSVGANPYSIVVSPDGSKAYVVNNNNGVNSVSVINTATNSVVATVPVGLAPVGAAVSPDGSRVYVTNLLANTVSVINTTSNSVVATVAVGTNPYGVSVSPDGSKVYVANVNSNNVSVINTATNTVVATVAVETGPNALGNFIANVVPVCTGATKTFTVTVNSFANATIALANTTQTLPVTGITYFSNGCTNNLIARVNPNGASPVSGNTTAKVWIESTTPTAAGNPFVKRHYELTPATNAATATGRVTLYFTQAEFDDFNAVSSIDLPTGPADAIGKANLKIEKRSGITNNGTGLPGSYTGTVINIDPVDADIVWNAAASRWEISFDVTGFSGFFVKTITGLLPISSINFSAVKQNNEVLLQWQNTSETNAHHYEAERSSNGSNFENIGNITARNAAGINSYQLSDNAVWTSELRYYRLKSVDNNGKVTYSPVVRLNSTQQNSISVYPNPVTDAFTIQLNGSNLLNSIAKLQDASGKTVQVITIKNNNQTVNISNLSKGIYLLQFEDGTVMKIIKQ